MPVKLRGMYGTPCSPSGSSGSDSSIKELLGALCNTCLSGVSWKRRALGAVSREGACRVLQNRAYVTLLAKIFQRGTEEGSPKPSLVSTIPPRNKVLMISFNLRLSGCADKADRLEQLLGELPKGPTSGVGELDSVLELLVQLAGSVPPPAPSFSWDYMSRKLPMKRHPQLTGYQSQELWRLEARVWSLICREEWWALGACHGTLRVMDAPPGTGLMTLGRGGELEERFERETRLSLFGALQHTRTSDLDIRLDLPPVPSNIEITGLAIRVPPYLDQSEDEGFQSASNLTPDSQSEPSPGPEIDIWEALRNYKPGRRRCWETIGCQTQLVGDLLNMLIGVASGTFPLNPVSVQFEVCPGVCISGTTPESITLLLGELAQYGTHYLRLCHFSLQSAHKRGLVFQAFAGSLRRYLHYYRACVLCTPPTLSLLTIAFLFRKLGRQLRYLSELCCVDGSMAACQNTFPAGVKLLSYLYNEAQSNCSNENYPILLSLLKSSCEPYTRFVSDWVYSGVFRDVYGEFMIQVNEDYLSFRDKNFWVQGYTLISQNVEECVPVFLRHIANDVYVCGKTINLLKICCPQHYICWSELPLPRIAVTFSLQEVEEIERDCAVYRGRMERIAKQSALSREEKTLHAEHARQELILQVRESTAKTLENIRGRQLSQHLAAEAKKRELFEELKEHLEHDREWHSSAKLKKQEEDFSFARELRDREKRLQALEEQLEQRARKELIVQYSQLSEEAAWRERRALWRAQRLWLHQARTRYLQEDQQLIEALLERFPLEQREVSQESPPLLASLEQPILEQKVSDGASERSQGVLDNVSTIIPQIPVASTTQPTPINNPKPLTPAEPNLNDFLNKLPRAADSRQVDLALQDIGSDLSEGNSALIEHDIYTDIPHNPLRAVWPRWGHAVQPHFSCLTGLTYDQQSSRNECQLSTVDSEIIQGLLPQTGMQDTCPESVSVGPVVEVDSTVQKQAEHLASAFVTGGEFKCSQICAGSFEDLVSQVKIESNEPIPTVQGSASDASSEPSEPKPLPDSTYGRTSDSTLGIGCIVLGTEPVPASLPGSAYGHSSDSVLDVSCVVKGPKSVQASLPGSAYGHSSESVLDAGCVVKGQEPVQASLPGSTYGHSSDSVLDAGCVVKGQEPVQASLPGSTYGHSSDSVLDVGCVVKGPEPVPASLPGSAYGHSSDSVLDVGCVVKGPKSVQASLPGSAYGHSSDSVLDVGCVVKGPEPVPASLPGSAYGHSSDSVLDVGCVVKGPEPVQASLPGSAYGHSSDSVLDAGCVVKGPEPVQASLPGSTYGHSLDSVSCVFKSTVPVQVAAVLDETSVNLDAKNPKFGTPKEHRLLEGMSVWPCSLPSGEAEEEDYLRCLATQYPVEQYQDDYHLLTAAYDSQLLQQIIRGPYGFPGSPAMWRATDATAVQLSEMVSLPVLMKHSVTTPLITHVSLVNKAVVDYFFVELEVEHHFEALRHFLLMEDGEFAQSLSDLLFEKLSSGQTPGELLTPLVLNSILSKALQYSLHGGNALAANFTFALRFLPERFHPHAPDALQCLELCYKVDWPLNIIITDSCMDKYNRLFSFLLQLKHMVWTLRDVWFHLKRAALVKGAGQSTQFRQLQLYRHEMQHFVKVIQGYIANQILQVSWSEFTHKLANISDLDSIHRTHADYLNRAIFRGLLTEKAAPVMNIIHSIFSLILKFRAQLIAQPWSNQQGEAVHPSFVAMQQSYNTFKYYSHFLFKVVTKLVNRGYQPHLEDFLLRINFNNYYKDF
ncbi:gamma-tubulin complex component 6 isoform X2 [Brienomyrus brachyistius]|uniref:gamma-tubulin complex component 6 isoform X2 n=1 Tax=Brienomyrus brachyistius TaxID=42636 RepID=UPI0020B2D552|nr:gamma-tubulin complex component 6 isoform X2 [Brienomyrus brachyistius]